MTVEQTVQVLSTEYWAVLYKYCTLYLYVLSVLPILSCNNPTSSFSVQPACTCTVLVHTGTYRCSTTPFQAGVESQLSSPQHDCVRYHHHHTITDGSNWQTLFLQYTAKSDRQRLRSNCYSMRDSTFKVLIDCLRIPKESIVHV